MDIKLVLHRSCVNYPIINYNIHITQLQVKNVSIFHLYEKLLTFTYFYAKMYLEKVRT